MLTLLALLGIGAVVNGPLFSLDASGKLGNAIVFSKWKGRATVREFVTPANPRTLPQRASRTMVALLNQLWAGASEAAKASWADLAAAGNYSNFNAFTGYNLGRIVTNDPPTVDRSLTPDGGGAFITGSSNVAGVGYIEFTFNLVAIPDQSYGLVALVKSATPAGSDLSKVVARFDALTSGSKVVRIAGLESGFYRADMFCVSNNGTLSAPVLTTGAILVS